MSPHPQFLLATGAPGSDPMVEHRRSGFDVCSEFSGEENGFEPAWNR
jgi:hypothetical protein